MSTGESIILAIVAFIFPPLTAGFISGCGADLCINIALTILGVVPGTVHALWLVYRKMRAEEQWGPGGYRYVGNGSYEGYPVLPGAAQGAPQAHAQAPPGYGSTNH